MAQESLTSDMLIFRAGTGDLQARGRLLELHWPRLVAMVSLRMDRRLSSQLDPADVVQQAMIVATRRMDVYLQNPEIPFFPWLYRLTLDRLSRAHERFLHSGGRVVALSNLAESPEADLSSGLAVDDGTSPSGNADRKDSVAKVQNAVARLRPKFREVMVMHYVESLTFREIAAILGVSESAARMRHARSLEELRRILDPSAQGIER